MAKASINIKAASATSELHNKREVKLDYNYPELEVNNESWEADTIAKREKEIQAYCKATSGRKLQKNATPIREGVVNLNGNHTMDDLKNLAKVIKDKHKIDCFQIHLHRDEGKSRQDLNHHAHMVFDWQDKETGKTLKLGRAEISQLQDTVAETLQMERGELRVNSNKKRLEPIEYKRQQEELKVEQLQSRVQELEQKKNRAVQRNARCADEHSNARERHRELEHGIESITERIRLAEEEVGRLEQEERDLEGAQQGQKEASRERTHELAREGVQMDKETLYEASNELSGAIKLQSKAITGTQQEIDEQERAIKQLEESDEYKRASVLIQRINILREQEKREERKQEYLKEARAKIQQGKKPW